MKCRFSLSRRDLEGMMRIRGAKVDHSILQRWGHQIGATFRKIFRENNSPHLVATFEHFTMLMAS